MEGRQNRVWSIGLLNEISIHAPHGGDVQPVIIANFSLAFQSSPPIRERHSGRILRGHTFPGFNPRPLIGGDSINGSRTTSHSWFQSTPLLGATFLRKMFIFTIASFNPRPTWGDYTIKSYFQL